MKRDRYLFLIIAIFTCLSLSANTQDSLFFKGQFSPWINLNFNNELPVNTGGNYIPQLNFSHSAGKKNLFDLEFAFNIYGRAGFHLFDSVNTSGNIKPYRGWIRYSSDQFELRLGLQKINFGSASLLRPLMWFDQMDPRDPLNLTDGVWALLSRYYFLNNANLWVWGLLGNNDPRAWEIIPANKNIPEFGGRIQIPVRNGEAAISYHHRTADNSDMQIFSSYNEKIPEDRVGFDARWDMETGFWIEGSWTRKKMDLGTLTNQEIFNAGIDYTLPFGNGLYVAYEHLLFSYDQKAFKLANRKSFSLLMFTYPTGLFDKFSAIVYYDWTDQKIYNFMNWEKQFKNVRLYLMGYWNPEFYQLPAQTESHNLFKGKGIQLMFVYNH